MDKLDNRVLTEEEELFCQLYVNGGIEYAGRANQCYVSAYNQPKSTKQLSYKSKSILKIKEISHRIKELNDEVSGEDDILAIKLQVTETLRSVMSEAATTTYKDKYGQSISPAPLRAVSVNAAKALADLYPIGYEKESKLKIEGGGEGGVVFNVIVPQLKKAEE